MSKERQLDILKAALNQVKFESPNIKRRIDRVIASSYKKTEQREITRRLKIQNKKLLEQVVSLKDKLKKNTADKTKIVNKLNYLMKINTSLSQALGSCPKCWGEDPRCNMCWGNGVPGWNNINKRFFNIYILPCVEKMYELLKENK
jgi:hypothetical protein